MYAGSLRKPLVNAYEDMDLLDEDVLEEAFLDPYDEDLDAAVEDAIASFLNRPGGAPSGRRPTRAPARRYFKDDPALTRVALVPARPIAIDRAWPKTRQAIAGTFNRLGGLIQALSAQVRIEPAAALAVWQVESGGRRHQAGRAIIRFENHLLFNTWGKRHPEIYDRHFRHGGRGGIPGKAWERHAFRESPDQPFLPFHGNQDLEYRVLALATRLAGESFALSCISIGGPQILVSNHRAIGYESPRAMYDAFQAGERSHVLGFFDFCQQHPRGSLLPFLRNRQWTTFARFYNGPGQAETYGAWINQAYQKASRLPIRA